MSAYQKVFDSAESISINRKPVVAQTVTRNNTVKSVNRGGDTWRFDVMLPDGIPWKELRPFISEMEALDRHTTSTIQINNSGYNSWLTAYQGDSDSTAGFFANAPAGNTVTITAYPSGHNLTSGDITFKAGDIIQLGTGGRVYSVAANVVYPSSTITVNRPIIDTGTSSIIIGPEVTWDVICMEFPTWNIFQINQVAWNGSFVFYEDMS